MFIFQAEIETVAKVTHEKGKRNDTQENKYGRANDIIWFNWPVGI